MNNKGITQAPAKIMLICLVVGIILFLFPGKLMAAAKDNIINPLKEMAGLNKKTEEQKKQEEVQLAIDKAKNVHQSLVDIINRCSKAQTAPCQCGNIIYPDLGEHFIQISNSDKTITLLDKGKAATATKATIPSPYSVKFLDKNPISKIYSVSSTNPQLIALDKDGLLADRSSYPINTEVRGPLTRFFRMSQNTIAITTLVSTIPQPDFIGYTAPDCA